MNNGIKRCTECVTPLSYPNSSPDSDGVCFYCRQYKNTWGNWDNVKEQRKLLFEKIVEKAKKKNAQYDVLVPFSGGKDSAYALYVATKVYNMKTLAYTFDNGFQSEMAKENIRNAVEASGADHYLFKMDNKKLLDLYKHFFKHTGMFCPVCMRGISIGRIVSHRQFKIPLIIRGTSMRTEEWATAEIFQASDVEFFRRVLKKYPVNFNVNEFYLDRNFREKLAIGMYILSGKKFYLGGTRDIQLPDYLDWDYKNLKNVIEKELCWRDSPEREEHADCIIDPIVDYLRKKKIPELTTNTLRYSAYIRAGMMKRDEALKLINKEMEEEKDLPKEVKDFNSSLNISKDDFLDWSKQSFRHMEFQKKGFSMRAFLFLRKFMGRNVKT
jgi:hypothetical protein